jgi:predicted dehydrogenase
MTEPLRLGVVGAGAILQVAHLPALRRQKGVQVAALCDTDVPKARALASRYSVPNVYDDIEDLLRHEALDAVLICTPNHLHEPHILAALSAGLHVLVEKPASLTSQGIQRLSRAVERANRVVMVGMNHRYRADTQAVRSFVQAGELGQIFSLQAGWYMARSARAPLGWRQRRQESGGGVLLDLGVTMLDLAFWLAGNPEPVRVSANLAGGGRGERAVEQSASAFVVCRDDLSVFVDVTWRYVGEGEYFGAAVRGSKGSASINPLRVWKEMYGAVHDVSPTTSGTRENLFLSSFRAQWAHFLAAVGGQVPPPSLEEHARVLRVIEAAYRSAADGKDVAV